MPSVNSFPLRRIPTSRHITSRIFMSVAQVGEGFAAALDELLGVVVELLGSGAGLPGSAPACRFPAGASCIIACPDRAPKTSPSSSELLASRLAPCTPVAAAAYRPGREVRPHRSVFTPPIM